METLQTILTVFIWFLCPILILLILVQGGAGDLSSTFGGGGQLDSTLGVGASRKMGKLTGWMSFAFLVIVLFMAIPPGGSFAAAAPGTGDPAIGDAAAADATEALESPLPERVVPPAPVPEQAPAEQPAAGDDAAAAEQPAAVEEVPAAGAADAGLEIDVGAQGADEE